jgi:hypothetical protein
MGLPEVRILRVSDFLQPLHERACIGTEEVDDE